MENSVTTYNKSVPFLISALKAEIGMEIENSTRRTLMYVSMLLQEVIYSHAT